MTARQPRARAQLALGADVAVKLLDSDLSSSAEWRFRLVQEVSAASRIDPAHVVRILDHGLSTGGRGFIVMERLQGIDLDQHLAQTPMMTPNDTAAIVIPVCAGLAAGHALGVVHGNIEPGNIFLHEAGDTVVVKLLNFAMPRNGDFEARAADRHSDLYALAVVAYRCLAARLPFQGTMPAGGWPPPVPPSTFNTAVSAELDAWFADTLRNGLDTPLCKSAFELGETFAAACGDRVPGASAARRPEAPSTAPRAKCTTVPKRGRARATLGGAVLVATASAILGLWLRHRGVSSGALEPGDTARPAAPDAPGPPLAIHIHLSVMPPEATLTLDGQRLGFNPFSTTRSADGALHRLRAEAPGYRSIERDISLSRDLTLELMLSPVAAPSPEAASAGRALREPLRSTSLNRIMRTPQPSSVPVDELAAREAMPELPARKKLPLSVDRTNPWLER